MGCDYYLISCLLVKHRGAARRPGSGGDSDDEAAAAAAAPVDTTERETCIELGRERCWDVAMPAHDSDSEGEVQRAWATVLAERERGHKDKVLFADGAWAAVTSEFKRETYRRLVEERGVPWDTVAALTKSVYAMGR
jgi:hypothetical protein